MPHPLLVAVWIAVFGYSFYISTHARVTRERVGSRLVGIGALVVLASLLLPGIEAEFTPWDHLLMAGFALAGVILAVGLIMALPVQWRQEKAEGEPTGDDAPADEGADQ